MVKHSSVISDILKHKIYGYNAEIYFDSMNAFWMPMPKKNSNPEDENKPANNFLKFSSLNSLFLFMYSIIIFPISMMILVNKKSYIIEWTIFQISSASMTFPIILDHVSLSFSNVVCLISACVMMFSSSYMSSDPFLKRFTSLVMLFVLSMNMLVFIPSLPTLLIGWDGLGIVSFVLVIYYQNMKSLGAGMITVLMNRIGDVMILISIGFMLLQGHWMINLMFDFHLSTLTAMTLTIAAMTKSAQIPFSSWLPAAMAAPTPVSALVHSSTLVTAGVFLIIRFFPFLNQCYLFKPFLLLVSVLTLLMAGIGANYENDLKKIIALSTLSQLGVMMLSLALGMPNLALFHLYTHALFKALLFLCAGSIIHNSLNWQDIRYMGFLSYQAPLTVTCLNTANMSLCGAPFMSGFYSKDLILELSLATPTNFIMVLLIFLATGMTAAYSFRLSFSSLWSFMKNTAFHSKSEKDLYINTPTYILALTAIMMGALMQIIFLDFNPVLLMIPYLYKMLTPMVIILGILIAILLWDMPLYKTTNSPYLHFMSNMWFLTPLSSQPITKFSMLMGTNMMKSVDFGWMEILGGQGSSFMTMQMSKLNQKIQMKLFNFFIATMLISILLILFILL